MNVSCKANWGFSFSLQSTQRRPHLCLLAVSISVLLGGFPGDSDDKESAYNDGDPGSNPGLRRFPWRRKWILTPVFLACRITGTEKPGGLQSMGSQKVGHNLATKQQQPS